MIEINLDNNEFLRQFEVKVNGSLARIEYAEQERKIFLTKLIVPENIASSEYCTLFSRIKFQHLIFSKVYEIILFKYDNSIIW